MASRCVAQLVARRAAGSTESALTKLGPLSSVLSVRAIPAIPSARSNAASSRSFATAAPEETRQAWRPNSQGAEDATAAAEKSPGQDAAAARAAAAEEVGRVGLAADTFPEMDDVAKLLEEMGLQPGRNCVIGDGLAVADVGLFLDVGPPLGGVKVAMEMEEERSALAGPASAREYALKRALRSVMQAHGWHVATVARSDWLRLDPDQRVDYLSSVIYTALSPPGHNAHGHKHGESCGHGHKHGESRDHGHSHGHHDHGHKEGGCCGKGDGSCGHNHSHGHGHKHEHGHKHDHGHKHGHGGGGGCGGGGGGCGGGGGDGGGGDGGGGGGGRHKH
ncbi:hypothetical protein HYH03_006890 [Edaphochlamys debaryana]|uniref:Uncharacterized protein n=1 Tax=Edaphochlamys debaryana TaxID=47281 RepID=A0A835Y2V6_9CHLO|nr:hypothetical protein HYH03_006890 [Edaphochlamys debaryana]|eukprot:KAG2494955.1 hypothetical protein HYH03_006890 [Edaphochlamys debaryana]